MVVGEELGYPRREGELWGWGCKGWLSYPTLERCCCCCLPGVSFLCSRSHSRELYPGCPDSISKRGYKITDPMWRERAEVSRWVGPERGGGSQNPGFCESPIV